MQADDGRWNSTSLKMAGVAVHLEHPCLRAALEVVNWKKQVDARFLHVPCGFVSTTCTTTAFHTEEHPKHVKALAEAESKTCLLGHARLYLREKRKPISA
eukprot:CAMPEP_0172692512 /NCGR_PEP_ID=MMETSP1074-20121228/25309_1 /TAXON_ID=2916 /ORGANISM="Ceratium fusus, Strain PA161109" /LENGTH=99 /DNA_ID=CAMNT_0013512731 /DNA_START=51 /DNA_END=347 /DNA_ORIENTATION=-